MVIDSRAGGLFSLGVDVVNVLDSAAYESVGTSSKDDKETDAPTARSQNLEESIKDSIIRDEHRLAELGRKTVEIFVVSHIFSEHIEVRSPGMFVIEVEVFYLRSLINMQNV